MASGRHGTELREIGSYMKILILTNEFPPNIYGGAGVHVQYLVRELSRIEDCRIQVLCFGSQLRHEKNVQVLGVDSRLQCRTGKLNYPGLMNTLRLELAMAGTATEADIIHCHTWYTHFAGCLLKQLLGGRLVLTTHSLEPHRPWKFEQLGNAYHASSWMERIAYENADGIIAVSNSMREDVQRLYHVSSDIIRVINNGINTEEYKPQVNTEVLHRYGINPDGCFILFVGRITRQKGIFHLVNAIPYIQSKCQIVLCAGAADTKELELEMSERVDHARSATRNKIVWIPQVVPKPEIFTLYSAAALFVCPSIYEPFGIINLEAMACRTPVIGSAVGGIPEIITPEETGLLVPFKSSSESSEPEDPDKFSSDLAAGIDRLLSSPGELNSMGKKARQRVEEHFSWKSVGEKTISFYREVVSARTENQRETR